MAALDFPNSPTIGDIFSTSSGSYQWTGTAWISNNLGGPDLQDYIDSRVQLVVDAAPETLNTLAELAASINNNADFAGAMNDALAGKADLSALETKKDEFIYQIAANNTLIAGGRYFVDTNGARTLTLPASPVVGDEIWVIDQTALSATNNITIDNNGSLINGVLDTLLIDVNGAVATLVYTGSTLGWRV